MIGLTNLGLGSGWSALIVALIGAVLVMLGSKNMKPRMLRPERTAHQLWQDAELVKEQVR